MNTEKDTLLIVDDVPTNLKILMIYLQELGFNINIARDGESALKQVRICNPELILLDIMMPGMNGFETCHRLKANKKTRDIPVIFMTALTDTVNIVKGFEAGAVDYITKPIQREEILARVTAHLTLIKQRKTLEKQKLELQQQNQELEAFAHTVAHDLKNPINLITGFSGMAIDMLPPSIDSQLQECLQNIEQAGDKMAHIVDALLLLASTRIGEVIMEPIHNMAEIIAGAQQRLAQKIKEYQGEIVISTTWPVAQGYAPWIEEVWTNYLSNGLKHGGKPPRLELGATPLINGYIRFWVRDNGQYIAKEEQSQLFIPFTNFGRARIEGHGLGLSIVQRIIERCGGKVGVESQKGQGNTFYFTLPEIEIGYRE